MLLIDEDINRNIYKLKSMFENFSIKKCTYSVAYGTIQKVLTLRGGGSSKTYKRVQGGGGSKIY